MNINEKVKLIADNTKWFINLPDERGNVVVSDWTPTGAVFILTLFRDYPGANLEYYPMDGDRKIGYLPTLDDIFKIINTLK